jgi:hypothetical protein
MAHSIQDPLLTGIKNKIESNLPEEMKEPVAKVVLAGGKVLYSPTTHSKVMEVYTALKQGGFQPKAIGNAVVWLLGLLAKVSQGNIDSATLVPAGTILLCYVLDDLEQTMGLKVDQALVQAAVSQLSVQIAKVGHTQGKAPQTGATPPPAAGAPPQPGGMAQQPMAPQGAM